MKTLRMVAIAVVVTGLLFSSAFAGGGNVEKGKAMFNDPKAFNGSGEKSCNSCHPDGKGLEKSTVGKKEWKTPVAVLTSLEDAINICILMANKGTALDPKSDEMKDLISYLKSLRKGRSSEMKEHMMEKKEEMMEKTKGDIEKKIPGY